MNFWCSPALLWAPGALVPKGAKGAGPLALEITTNKRRGQSHVKFYVRSATENAPQAPIPRPRPIHERCQMQERNLSHTPRKFTAAPQRRMGHLFILLSLPITLKLLR